MTAQHLTGIDAARMADAVACSRPLGGPSGPAERPAAGSVYQEEALRFYEGAGFRRCGPFGPYAAMPPRAIELSLFYEKPI